VQLLGAVQHRQVELGAVGEHVPPRTFDRHQVGDLFQRPAGLAEQVP
jgi:hypothetical protein